MSSCWERVHSRKAGQDFYGRQASSCRKKTRVLLWRQLLRACHVTTRRRARYAVVASRTGAGRPVAKPGRVLKVGPAHVTSLMEPEATGPEALAG